ncbi:hypothetical protein Tsubulata_016701 [Turnera subulata]|uniref:Endonuclease/exonuclease/phosphatase domain-containing protein n=1 Tax=Turnera subulata TaxID=218843 RepID=A0A9Q0FZI5_9ROSI|nr:hypothetical protein Tsubulata_016701 [Turnera subulata]
MKELQREYKPTVVIVVEPRISGARANRVIRKLGFTHSHRVDARGFAGGVWVLWNERVTSVSVLHCHTQFIHMKVNFQGLSFLLTAVYGSPQEQWRRFLWRNIEALATQITEPWILAGDFNAILTGDERQDRWRRNGVGNYQFLNCVNEAQLIDLGFAGPKFTWRRNGDQARLDRMLGNVHWLNSFAAASILHLPFLSSDHRPILLRLEDLHPTIPK